MSFSNNTSITSLAFIRIDFEVRGITDEEDGAILQDIEKFMRYTNPTLLSPLDMRWREEWTKFSLFYNKDNDEDEERVDKFFFKLKLRHPEFKITSKPTCSFRS